MFHHSPNAHLIGQPNSRAQLATPCLVLDLTKLQANIAVAAAHAKARGFALRPHGKSHKCASIAKLQIAAGANGLCVATIGEAERLSHAGITDMLVTSDIAQPGKIARAVAMAGRGIKLNLVADDPGVVDAIAASAATANVRFDVLVDVDLGRKRNGVTTAEQALAVTARIAAGSHLTLAGMQTYASHISHTPSFADRLAASQVSADTIRYIKTTLEAAGHVITTISGGSTGTLFIDPDLGCYTELQAGSYVFNDAEYIDVDLDGHHTAKFEPALTVAVSVIGRNVPGRVTCDGGNKQFSAKGTLPIFLCAPVEGAVYRPDSDEHGIIELPVGAAQPALGAGFELIVPHCDPTVNLYDWYHVVEGDRLVAIWPIEGRGAF
jgi:3-hydroxy-D-aspartate aldolase